VKFIQLFIFKDKMFIQKTIYYKNCLNLTLAEINHVMARNKAPFACKHDL